MTEFLISTKSPTLAPFPICEPGRTYANGPTVQPRAYSAVQYNARRYGGVVVDDAVFYARSPVTVQSLPITVSPAMRTPLPI